MTLIVHHLGVSQSERVVWLCEELGIDYELKHYKRSPLLSPPEVKALHPLGAAPIIQDGDITLAESGACMDYIIHIHGKGKLAIPPGHKDYADYLYWFNFGNGTLQPGLSRLMSFKMAELDDSSKVVQTFKGKFDNFLKLVDDRVAKSTWLAGEEFTAADVMSVFTLTTMRTFYPFDLSPYSNILAYLQRVVKRPAYLKAREKGDPGLELMIGGPPPKYFLSK